MTILIYLILKSVDQLNSSMFNRLEGKVHKYFPKKYWLDENLKRIENSSAAMTKCERELAAECEPINLKVGTRIMMRVNDYAKNIFNGMIGTVTMLTQTEVFVLFDNEEYSRIIPRHTYEIKLNNMRKFVVEQYGLCYAWAMTIHKAQGLTLDTIVLDLSKSSIFESHQAYVGLSRARSLSGVFLIDLCPNAICRICPNVANFYKTIQVNKYIEEKAEIFSVWQIYDFDDLCPVEPKECSIAIPHANLSTSLVKMMATNGMKRQFFIQKNDEPTYWRFYNYSIFILIDHLPKSDQFWVLAILINFLFLSSVFKYYKF